jgi:hypothetical protein
MTPTIHTATAAQIADVGRRIALGWLRSVAARPEVYPDAKLSPGGVQATACELRLAIEYGKRPSESAAAWLRERCESADLEVRASAREAARVVRV